MGSDWSGDLPHLPVVELHPSGKVILEGGGMVQRAGVQPDPARVPGSCPPQRIGQQRPAETAPDEVRRESEVRHLDRLGVVAAQLVVAGGRAAPGRHKGAQLFVRNVALPLLITPALFVDPGPPLADQQIERAIQSPISLNGLTHHEIGVRNARRDKRLERAHLEVGDDDFWHGPLGNPNILPG